MERQIATLDRQIGQLLKEVRREIMYPEMYGGAEYRLDTWYEAVDSPESQETSSTTPLLGGMTVFYESWHHSTEVVMKGVGVSLHLSGEALKDEEVEACYEAFAILGEKLNR